MKSFLPGLVFGLCLWLLVPAAAADENWQRVTFRETDALFANPDQGWLSSSAGKPRLPCSVVYQRFEWADLEPAEGKYQWQSIDDVIAAAKARGAAVAFRIMTCNAHSRGYYSSPKWLFDAGCKGFEYLSGGGDPTSGGQRISRMEPDYADPIYLAKHAAFLAELGRRYDGSLDVAFLDIGSYGIWGEWHTPHAASLAVRRQIIDFYLRAFRKTPLVFMSDDVEGLSYALAHGTGMRRDGVGSPWHEQHWIGSSQYAGVPDMAEAWKKAPVVFEWFGNYDYLQSKGWSFDAAVNFMLANHVTMINDNIGRVPPATLPALEKLARLAGYRFVLRALAHEKTVQPGAALDWKMKWANVGVGKLYRARVLRLALCDDDGNAAVITDARSNPADWLPGEFDLTEPMKIPATMKPGEYHLALAIADPSNHEPPLRLAMDAPEKAGWYVVSRVTVE